MALTTEQMARLNTLLDEAVDLDEDGRRKWLQQLRAEHDDLRAALEWALLGGHPRRLTLPSFVAAGRGHRAGDIVGPYALIRLLGKGGMAQVWLARRADGVLKREVALKLPSSLKFRGDMAARFERERDILAGLEHPNIARLYDAGVGQEGLPYLAMEYVDGKEIAAWCDMHRCSIRERLELFVQVLDAVEYAHGRGVLHRDIKPSNVLVTEARQVRLLDFGVARLLEQGQENLTQEFGGALTPAYASPEQLQEGEVGTASDVYSLGVMLHELLCGVPPRAAAGAKSEVPAGALVEVRTAPGGTTQAQLDGPPSTQVDEAVARARSANVARVTRQLKGDLDAVVSKALAPRAEERYASARALAQDLKAYLAGLPVAALPVAPFHRLVKFLLREPMAGVAALAVLVALAATLYASVHAPATVTSGMPDPAGGVASAAGAGAAGPAVNDRSLAVLAFADLSEKRDQEFFSDGLAEELTDLLARVPGLHVAARTSAFYFKGRQATVEEIGRALHVANVLEGSVRRAGNRLRVTTQLVSTRSGEHLWSQTYERTMQDVFQVQDEIAGAVATALKVQLGMGRRGAPYRPRDAEAHLQFLLGEQLYYKNTEESYVQAIAAYKNAIRLDARYAAAFAGLSVAEYYLADVTGKEALIREATGHANKAIEIDPQEPYGYLARENLEEAGWQWLAALADANKALELDPENGRSYRRRSVQEQAVGNLPAAIADARKAVDLDPLNASGWNSLGWSLTAADRFSEARKAFERGAAADGGNPFLHFNYAILDLVEGKYGQAQRQCGNIAGYEAFQLICASMAEHSLGHGKESRVALARLEAKFAALAAYQIAEVHAWRGENDLAFQWLDRAVAGKDGGLQQLAPDPLLRNLHSDARFGQLKRRILLPD
jgi:serine/threonine protein kinase/TolB-like protein/cytochrome c-type biogenesis protein CcmH/NrfG